ncbi:MAG: PAS domain S-box protein, partial [Candidatus Thermoplasmatota archaeon]|nr:PAS domain S-box protein [Candidatus Thermoplasmatota archaeon]
EERIWAETELRKVNMTLRTLSKCNGILIRATDEKELLEKICDMIVKSGGYRMAWVGFAEQDAEKTVRPVAHSGYEEKYLESLKMTWADNELGRGPVGTAIRTGKPCVVKNILSDPSYAQWRMEAIKRGYSSMVALPLIANGTTFGALAIYSAETDFFDAEEMPLLEELADDLAYGMAALRMREERKSAEGALKDSETRYRRLFEAAKDGILILDWETGQIVDVNPFIVDLLGFSHNELLGKKLWEIGIFKDIAANKMAFEELKARGRIRYEDLPLETKSGRRISVEFVSNVYEVDHTKVVQCNIRDITERKKAEESLHESESRYRTIVESTEDLITLVDINGKFLFVNHSAQKIFGLKPEDCIGKSAFDFIHPEDRQATMDAFRKWLVSKDETAHYENRQIHVNGGASQMLWTISKVYGEKNHVAGFLSIARDITERKKAEDALYESEAQLSNAARIAKLGYWEYNVLNDLFTFTDSFYAIFHTTAEKAGGYTMPSAEYAKRFVHPDDAALVGEEVRKTIETKDPNFSRQLEHRMIYADGGTGYISVRFFIVKDKSGRTVKTYGVNQDITEQKKAEESLKDSEEKFRTLYESARDAIVLIDMDGKITDVNPAAHNIYGISREALVGKSFMELDFLKEEELPKLAEMFGRYLNGENVESLETTIRVEDEDRYVEAYPSLLKKGGQASGVQVILRDITDKKKAETAIRESEEKFRLIAENSFDGIFTVNLEGKLSYASPSAERIYGYKREEIVGKDVLEWMELVGVPGAANPFAEKMQDLAKGNAVTNLAFPSRKKDGTPLFTEINATPIIMDGEFNGIHATVRDVTERKKTEETKVELEAMKHLGEMKTKFVSVATHELRTPVVSIKGYTDLLM